MKKIQSGVIQTILEENGRLSHYRLTLWVPREYAELIEFKNISTIGNKFLYCPTSKDFDVLERIKTSAQVIINDMKIAKLTQRKTVLLSRLALSTSEPIFN